VARQLLKVQNKHVSLLCGWHGARAAQGLASVSSKFGSRKRNTSATSTNTVRLIYEQNNSFSGLRPCFAVRRRNDWIPWHVTGNGY